MILENTVSGRRGIIDDWMAADFEPKSTKPKWLDSELIPRLLENFENWKNFMIILLNVKNDAYRRFFGA